MKIQLIHNGLEITAKDDFSPTELSSLPQVENASCTDIRMGTILDNVKERNTVLDMAVGKLRYGGTISFEGLDIVTLAHSVVYGQFTNMEACAMIYGKGRQSISDLTEISLMLKERGLLIKTKSLDGPNFFVEAERQKPNE